MKLKFLTAGISIGITFMSLVADVPAQERLPAGWFHPVGHRAAVIATPWLSDGCSGNGDYEADLFHIGADIRANLGDPVFAPADGVVMRKSLDGWGDGNVALFIKSRLHSGRDFLILLGHIRTTLTEGGSVIAGKQVGTIGPWPLGSHLHLGVVPVAILPTASPSSNPLLTIGLGRVGCSHWRDAAATHVSLYVDRNWSPEWELRMLNGFSFTNQRKTQVAHATRIGDAVTRFVMFYDLDRAQWAPWRAVLSQITKPPDVQARFDMADFTITDARFVGAPMVNSFTEPTAWLTTPPDDVVNRQAKVDLARAAQVDSRFVGNGPGYGADVNWTAGWELRWQEFVVTGNRFVPIYHATSSADHTVRATGYVDPDSGVWRGWVPVR